LNNRFKTTKNPYQRIHPKENPYQPIDFKISRKRIGKPKDSRLLPNVCDFHKGDHTLWYGFKNLSKIYSLA
jgi:hypothetical protein